MVSVLKKILWFVSILIVCITPKGYADNIQDPTSSILEQAPAEAAQLYQEGFSFSSILSSLGELFLGELKTISSHLPFLILVLIFYGIKNCMDFSHSLNRAVSLGCFSATALLTGEIFHELSLVAEDMLTHLADFVYLTIPALTGLVANGGRVLSAAKSTYFILGFMNLLVFVIEKIFFPLILLYFVFSVISALLEKDYFEPLKNTLSSVIKTVLPLLVGIFTTLLSIVTSLAKSSDELTVKTAKMALGNCIPFLGNVLTDSGEYLIQAISQIKAQAGVAGIIGMCYIFLLPLVKILSGVIIMKGLSVFAGFLQEEKSTAFYENVGSSLGMLAGIMGTVGIIAILGVMIVIGI